MVVEFELFGVEFFDFMVILVLLSLSFELIFLLRFLVFFVELWVVILLCGIELN